MFKIVQAVYFFLFRAAIVISVNCVALMFIWFIICSFDQRPPIENLSVSVKNTTPGGKIRVTYIGYRYRQCRLKQTRTATDTKGEIVYTHTEERLINGEFGYFNQIDDYTIDEDSKPGPAIFSVYYNWHCPYNIAHYILPIKLHISIPFTINNKISIPQ